MDKKALKAELGKLSECIEKACQEIDKENPSIRILGDILMEDFEDIKNEVDLLLGFSELHHFKCDSTIHAESD